LILIAVPMSLALIFTYDVVKIDWRSTMEDQPAVEAQQGPRLAAPAEAVRFDGVSSLSKDGALPDNPVPADAVSLQRGEILFNINCVPCHGKDGKKISTAPPLGSVAGNAVEMLHKVMNGQPGEAMPALRALDHQVAADIAVHLQTLPQ